MYTTLKPACAPSFILKHVCNLEQRVACSETVGNCRKPAILRYELCKLLSNMKINLVGYIHWTQTFLYAALELTKIYHQLFPLTAYHRREALPAKIKSTIDSCTIFDSTLISTIVITAR